MLRSRLHALACLVLLSSTLLFAQNHSAIAAHVRGEMSFLASDALRGRGSATHDELVAATYVVSPVPVLRTGSRPSSSASRSPTAARPTMPSPCSAAPTPRSPSRPFCSAPTSTTSACAPLPPAKSSTTEPMTMPAEPPPSSSWPAPSPHCPPSPRRTIVFVCFGSEETGGQGDQYFFAAPAHSARLHRRQSRVRDDRPPRPRHPLPISSGSPDGSAPTSAPLSPSTEPRSSPIPIPPRTSSALRQLRPCSPRHRRPNRLQLRTRNPLPPAHRRPRPHRLRPPHPAPSSG